MKKKFNIEAKEENQHNKLLKRLIVQEQEDEISWEELIFLFNEGDLRKMIKKSWKTK